MSTTTTTVRLPSALAKRLAKLTKATDRNRSWLTVDAVRHYLDVQEWQVAETLKGIEEADEDQFAKDEEVSALGRRWKRDAH